MVGTHRASAHQVELIYLKIDSVDSEADRWQGIVYFDAGYALAEMREDADAPQPRREWLLSSSEDQLWAIRNGAEGYIRECLAFEVMSPSGDIRPLDYVVDFPDFSTDPPNFPSLPNGGAYLRIQLSGGIPVGSVRLRVLPGDRPSYTVDIEEGASVIAPENHIVLFTRKAGSHTVEVAESSQSAKIWGFLKLGFAHVFPDGWDHILFIIGLFIAALRLRALVHLSLMFTIAHSLTLGLMVSGYIQLSDFAIGYVVEPMIALSIAWIAMEHFFIKERGKRIRLSVVFLFGLIHGLGFASSLRQGIQMDEGWMAPLVSANVGIELAQLLILAICVILFHRQLNKPWFSRLRTVSSCAIGMVGIWWFISRIFALAI